METKPLSPRQHAINDYALAGTLCVVPTLIGLNKKAIALYKVLGTNLLAYNAITDHSMTVKPVISLETHKKIDYANLASLFTATFYKGIRKQNRAMAFHIGVAAIAALNVLLTDWDKKA